MHGRFHEGCALRGACDAACCTVACVCSVMGSARTAADHFCHSRSVQSHSLRLRSHLHHSRLIRQRDCSRPPTSTAPHRRASPRCDATEACTVAAKQRFAYTAVALTKRAKRYGQTGEGMSGRAAVGGNRGRVFATAADSIASLKAEHASARGHVRICASACAGLGAPTGATVGAGRLGCTR